MKRLPFTVLLLFALTITAIAQVPQGTAMRATNGIGFGITTIANRLLATNTAGTNHFAGTLNVRSNVSSQAIFYGDGSGLTNLDSQTFTNLAFQDLSVSLNTFGDSIVSGEAGPPGWVSIMKTNLDDATEIINYGGSGYQQHNITDVFLATGGHTNEPYLMEVAYNGYTGDPAVDGSNRLYFIRVAVSNTPSPKRFLLLQMINDQSSSNGTPRHEFTTNLNAQIAALYPDNYYAWWDWFKLQGDGSAQDNADLAADVPPSSLMNADGIHPNSLGNYRLGTNMAGVWRNYLRSYQEPLLTGDIPTMLRGLTNLSFNVKNLTVGSGEYFEQVVFTEPSGNILMGNTNGVLYWDGTNAYGGIAWYDPGHYMRLIRADPTNGDLVIGQTSFTSTTEDVRVDSAGNLLTRGTLYSPNIILGVPTTAVAHSIDSPAFEDLIASMYLRTYSYDGVVMSPRLAITTALSGTGDPGIGQVIVTNANLNIASGFTSYGNASGLSNAVDLIASGCIQITTNANGRTFTLSIAGSGADVLTNSRAGATLVNLTLTGPTTNTGTFVSTGAIQSTNTATANTALTLNGAASGANGIVLGYDTNGVNKVKFENDGDGTLAGSLTVSSFIQASSSIIAGAGNSFNWNGRSALISPANGRVQFTTAGGGAGAQLESLTLIPTNGIVMFALDNIPTNSIPASTAAYTNWVHLNWTNTGPVYVATNIAASGSFLLRVPTTTLSAWPP